MLDRTLSELQVELFNRLRAARYARLKKVALERQTAVLAVGERTWWATSLLQSTTRDEIVRDLQRRFAVRSDPLDALHNEHKSS